MLLCSQRGAAPTRWLTAIVVFVVALGVVWWLARGGPAPTAAPTFETKGPLDHAQLVAYARTLHYDTGHGAGETRRLMIGCPPGPCAYGPRVRIEPEQGTAALNRQALAQGRVLARLIKLDSMPYAKLGLGAGADTVYWLVRDSAGQLRSWYVSSNVRRAITGPDSLMVREYPKDRRWSRSFARFVFKETDEGLWIPCLPWGCCSTTSGEI